MIGDLWEQNAFLRECERYGQKIADAAENIIVIFGNIAVDPKKKNNDGRVRKYNAAFAACNGQFLKNDRGLSYTIKTLLPDYRQFDDKRHFTSLPELAAEEINLYLPACAFYIYHQAGNSPRRHCSLRGQLG